MEEVASAAKRMSQGKSAGGDGVAPEFWNVLAGSPDTLAVLGDLLNRCWSSKQIPAEWRHATIVTLFKKGDPTLPDNYRPISLLAVGHKVFAALLHRRLINGGAEDRMRESQYGFRPKRGTADALLLVRRMIDAAHQSNTGGLLLLMLDWAKLLTD